MSKRTLTAEEIADVYEMGGDDESNYSERTRGRQAFFEKRVAIGAGVVAEETEWEYAEIAENGIQVWPVDPDARPDLWEEIPSHRRFRRRKAGPWVPVKHEGATDAS